MNKKRFKGSSYNFTNIEDITILYSNIIKNIFEGIHTIVVELFTHYKNIN